MELFFLFHLLLMLLGFVSTLAGVIIVRYFRKKMWWFRRHKLLGTIATIFLGVGGAAAVFMVQLSDHGHFTVPHTWLGGAVIVLMTGTLAAGLAQTRVVDKKRMRLIHRFSGRTVAVLCVITVVTGLMAAGIIPGP
jgi:hypothetical protein